MKRTIGLALVIFAGTVMGASLDPNNPTGRNGLVLIDKVGHHIRFVDPSSYQELSDFETGVNPHDLAFSPDHRTLYVPIYGDGVYGRNPHPGHEIVVVNLATRMPEGTIDVSPYQAPHGIQVDSAGLLYVTCDLSRKLLVIDPRKRKVVSAIDTEGTGHWVAVLPDGSKAYVANKNDKTFVTVIDLKWRKVMGHVATPNGTQGIAASPDGKHVAVVDYSEPAVMIIDTVTDKVADRVTLQDNTRGAFKPRYTPDGSKLVVCSLGNGMVNILDTADLHGKQAVLHVGKDPMGFAVSPDGKTLLVANHGDGTVSVIDLASDRVVKSFMGGTGIETLAYY